VNRPYSSSPPSWHRRPILFLGAKCLISQGRAQDTNCVPRRSKYERGGIKVCNKYVNRPRRDGNKKAASPTDQPNRFIIQQHVISSEHIKSCHDHQEQSPSSRVGFLWRSSSPPGRTCEYSNISDESQLVARDQRWCCELLK
jgi:hypothetical protein